MVAPSSLSMDFSGKSAKCSSRKRKREKRRKPNPPDDMPGVQVKFDKNKHILNGRGEMINNNPANKVWRAAIVDKLSHYHRQDPEYGGKSAVSESVVEGMYERGLSFATLDSHSDMVHLNSFTDGVNKTSQCFRDNKPKELANSKQSGKPSNTSKTSKKGKKSKKK